MRQDYYIINSGGVDLFTLYHLVLPYVSEGNAMKYVVRAGRKGGPAMEAPDLWKALDYIKDAWSFESRSPMRPTAVCRAANDIILQSDTLPEWKKEALCHIVNGEHLKAEGVITRRINVLYSIEKEV